MYARTRAKGLVNSDLINNNTPHRYLITKMGIGASSMTRAMRAQSELFETAAGEARLIKSLRLDLDKTTELMATADLSFKALQCIKTLLREWSCPLSLAPVAQVRAFHKTLSVQTTFHKVDLKGGTKEAPTTVTSLVMSASIPDILGRDMNYIFEEDAFVPRPTFGQTPVLVGTPVIHDASPTPESGTGELDTMVFSVSWISSPDALYIMITQDKGGQSSKWCIRILNVENPCSYKWCSLFSSFEPYRQDAPKMACDDHGNFSTVLSLAPGYSDVASFCVLQIFKEHVVIPKMSLPMNSFPVVMLDSSELLAFMEPPSIDSAESVAQGVRDRAAVVPGSAALVLAGNRVLGVQADMPDNGGSLTFPFRNPVQLASPEQLPSNVTVYPIEPFFSADLLALACCLGAYT